jgi:hypothetical protein
MKISESPAGALGDGGIFRWRTCSVRGFSSFRMKAMIRLMLISICSCDGSSRHG